MAPLSERQTRRLDAVSRLRGVLMKRARYAVYCTKRVPFREKQRFQELEHVLLRDLSLREARMAARSLEAAYHARCPAASSWVRSMFGIRKEPTSRETILAIAEEVGVPPEYFELKRSDGGCWIVGTVLPETAGRRV